MAIFRREDIRCSWSTARQRPGVPLGAYASSKDGGLGGAMVPVVCGGCEYRAHEAHGLIWAGSLSCGLCAHKSYAWSWRVVGGVMESPSLFCDGVLRV